ncbi:hypothetical protein BZZ08_01711 [Streptomyces sp. MH60]|nr:hypothetical protein BZZ08_01711 [Streptomyces sp. MH60]
MAVTPTNPFRGVGRPRPTLAWIGKALATSGRQGEFELDRSSLTPGGRRDQLDVIREWFPVAFETRAGRPPTQQELETYGDDLLSTPEERS